MSDLSPSQKKDEDTKPKSRGLKKNNQRIRKRKQLLPITTATANNFQLIIRIFQMAN